MSPEFYLIIGVIFGGVVGGLLGFLHGIDFERSRRR